MTKARRRRGGKRNGWALIVLYAVLLAASGLLVYVGRGVVLDGGPGNPPSGRTSVVLLRDQNDLPKGESPAPPLVSAIGIPDYEHVVHLSYRRRAVDCYRLLGADPETSFGNLLCVCMAGRLAPPEGIDEIIREKEVQGSLVRLRETPFRRSLQTAFESVGATRLSEGGFVLMSGPIEPPSRTARIAWFSGLAACCFFLYRLISAVGPRK